MARQGVCGGCRGVVEGFELAIYVERRGAFGARPPHMSQFTSRLSYGRTRRLRLHLRYGKEGLGEDLVFRVAPPIADVNDFKRHVDRFLQAMPKYRSWKKEYVGIAPVLDADARAILTIHDILPRDLNDLTAGLT